MDTIKVAQLGKLLDEFKRNYGVILSYGESQDLIPVGTFAVKTFLCNINGTNNYDIKNVEKFDEIIVELIKVEM